MKKYSRKAPNVEDEDQEAILFANSLVSPLREPVLVLNHQLEVLAATRAFGAVFNLKEEDIPGEIIYNLEGDHWDSESLHSLLEIVLPEEKELKDVKVACNPSHFANDSFLVNARQVLWNGRGIIILSFKTSESYSQEVGTLRSQVSEILSNAPAMICLLKGPDHIFEVANEQYLQFIGKGDIIGKKARQVVPEAESQGFFELLDKVYSTGEAFVGNEVPIQLNMNDKDQKNSFLNFVYQPTYNSNREVDGIFVHIVDVTEQVVSRKKIEESETELRQLINTVPAMIWITNKEGYSIFLNKSWYEYTGQKAEEAQGYGWVEALHPDDKEPAKISFLEANRHKKPYSATFRLRNTKGEYRWVIDNGMPQYNKNGDYEGMVGTVVDVHEEKVKEQLIREKEHRIRSMVEEADVATAVYTGREMKIELANEAMIKVWGKDSSVKGKTLREALPELEGQPFHQLLDDVFTTGKTYWGKEDKVDLVIDGKLKTGFFNFTYKPLRNEKGEIYGILNMATDVTEMVESRNLLKESETYFRQMTDLIPEKFCTTDPEGNFIYFNRHWLEYTGLSKEELQKEGWSCLVHPEETEIFEQKWQHSLDTGNNFEMEVRYRDINGKYKWHLRRAEAVRDENDNIKFWIGTNTEIHRLKEEEKRKESFLKMVSHELKTPVTSIKGYVQLLLNLLRREEDGNIVPLPLKPSLERIDHQIVRLTRLISEMLDLSRIEENKLELQKSVFSINELVTETVQDIHYTNTQHRVSIIHEHHCKIYADKDRIGQVLINFITNAIKYSPESREVKVYIQRIKDGKVAVSVRDRGIGIDKANHKNIFKRFYRVGVESEETYSGFGIGLYLAKEIIQRHNGSIKVKSKIGEGSDFTFILDGASNT
jgi:PAS domain S-box-containing protein